MIVPRLDKVLAKESAPSTVVNHLIQENLDIGAMHLLARLCFRGIYVPQMTMRS